MSDEQGPVVVVTGGTGFLGAAVCEKFLATGAEVHVAWLHEVERDRFPHAERCTMHRVELTDESAVEAFYAAFDGLHASIHIAGGFAMGPIESMTLADFEAMHRMNTVTAFLCCREAVRAMRRGAGGGRIVNVGARPAVEPAGGMLAYTTSKAAVTSLTQCLAKEVLADSILVNAVLPSIMDTPANRAGMPDADFSSWPRVEQVADAIEFLASSSNQLTTGTLLPVYGRA
jgi:NAD(P)-dependent dehydrogenase (short-subunit alcohol dehydrogenase family)